MALNRSTSLLLTGPNGAEYRAYEYRGRVWSVDPVAGFGRRPDGSHSGALELAAELADPGGRVESRIDGSAEIVYPS